MNFNIKTHESLMLLAGLLILVEQEAVRLVTSLLLATPVEPSQLMSGAGVTLTISSIGASTARNIYESKKNGDEPKDGGDST